MWFLAEWENVPTSAGRPSTAQLLAGSIRNTLNPRHESITSSTVSCETSQSANSLISNLSPAPVSSHSAAARGEQSATVLHRSRWAQVLQARHTSVAERRSVGER